LQSLLGSQGIRFIHFDIPGNEKELEHLTVDHDLFIDLVAMANPSLYVSNPIDVFKLNFTENLKIAEFCVKMMRSYATANGGGRSSRGFWPWPTRCILALQCLFQARQNVCGGL
jgi:hypothetical protein